jgi:hypothetical protein
VRDLSDRPPAAFGVDLAKSVDWTVVCGLDDAGAVCVLHRFQADWRQTMDKVESIVRDRPAYVDSTGVGDPIVEELSRRCTRLEGFRFSSSSKQQIMEGLAAAIQRGEIAFPDGWLRAELESFEFEYRSGGVRYSSPDGLHDDGVCALALACRRRGEPSRGGFGFRVF